MQKKVPTFTKIAVFLAASALAGGLTFSNRGASAQILADNGGLFNLSRPQYRIDAQIDYDLLTLKSSAQVQIPVKNGDSLRDAVFFLYANAGGVGGDDERRKNLVVDGVSMNGAPLPWKLDGAVLRVQLPTPQTSAFTLKIDYHGVVPRGGKDAGMGDMMGALGGDVSSLLGIGSPTKAEKPKNTDYGLYTYGNGIFEPWLLLVSGSGRPRAGPVGR